jgi:hypothetical protein
METMTPVHAPHVRSTRTDRGRFAGTLRALEVGLCVAAFGGAAYLISSPHTAMTPESLARTPFSSWLVPGFLLAACVAVPAAVVAYGSVTRRTYAHVGHPLVGVALIGWIVVQLVVIGPVSWLQPVMAGWGLVILVLGVAHYRRWHPGKDGETS